ncbi:tripartite tricarboxylate transporter substrate binding protein [Leisingera sp. ANG59]|uniref:tripartite tricarboxylate transporter substrate binding protein n=1 Tax=Leisingera sp. ANG59 TaxID=2675221 RepID=UPI001573680E|nr:tripartite tricarboxylate transporter substrate binding protein [Leisingera sp. ANG59]NSY40384.1 hypothetical protein [Leisingera sp. ANG59]
MKIINTLKAAVCAAAVALPGAALADWQPDGPITLQVGFGAGGSTDTLARAVAAEMEENTGWDVVVENKPGGGGIAMFSQLVNARPDGLTMGMGVTIPTLINLAERGETLPFKADSFDYLATVAVAPLAVVAPADAPYDNIAELIAYSKENGGALVGFDGGEMRLMMQAINNTEGAGFELVNYQSGAEIIQGLLGGQLQAGWGAGAHIQYIESDDLKMLAVATQTRQAYAPDTTSFIEQGFPYSAEPYFYIAAPKGLDPEARDALASALDAAITSDALTELVGNVMQTTPTNLGADGTEAKLVNGLSEITSLIEAAGN